MIRFEFLLVGLSLLCSSVSGAEENKLTTTMPSPKIEAPKSPWYFATVLDYATDREPGNDSWGYNAFRLDTGRNVYSNLFFEDTFTISGDLEASHRALDVLVFEVSATATQKLGRHLSLGFTPYVDFAEYRFVGVNHPKYRKQAEVLPGVVGALGWRWTNRLASKFEVSRDVGVSTDSIGGKAALGFDIYEGLSSEIAYFWDMRHPSDDHTRLRFGYLF